MKKLFGLVLLLSLLTFLGCSSTQEKKAKKEGGFYKNIKCSLKLQKDDC